MKRVYFHNTGYAGGASWTLAYDLHAKDPTKVGTTEFEFLKLTKLIQMLILSFLLLQVMHFAVYRAMKSNLQRRYVMCRLHLIPDDNIPEEIHAKISNQLRTARPVPKRIDEYDEETIKNFPKIMDYPKEYVIK